jgi:hypothetical protein
MKILMDSKKMELSDDLKLEDRIFWVYCIFCQASFMDLEEVTCTCLSNLGWLVYGGYVMWFLVPFMPKWVVFV